MDSITIERVAGRRDLAEFLRFPWEVYRGDPNWVPPLLLDLREKLDRKRNPFFEHAEMDLCLARRAGRVVGRVAAILDPNHNAFHDEKVVFFGLYESLDDPAAAAALLDAVAAWGRERGMTVLRGPMSLSMNDECAFLAEGFDTPPVFMMPYNPRFYLDLMTRSGLVKAKDLFAFIMSRDHEAARKVEAIVDKARREIPVTIRALDPRNVDEEAAKIVAVYNSGWQKNWGFVPWTESEMRHTVAKLKKLADLNLVLLAEVEGRPVGFAFGLPNYNEVLRKMNGRLFPLGWLVFLLNRKRIKGMRALVFGIVRDYQHTGLAYLLYSELERNAVRRGYAWGELSWQLEDNEAINRFAATIGAKPYKRYRIYERPIP